MAYCSSNITGFSCHDAVFYLNHLCLSGSARWCSITCLQWQLHCWCPSPCWQGHLKCSSWAALSWVLMQVSFGHTLHVWNACAVHAPSPLPWLEFVLHQRGIPGTSWSHTDFTGTNGTLRAGGSDVWRRHWNRCSPLLVVSPLFLFQPW